MPGSYWNREVQRPPARRPRTRAIPIEARDRAQAIARARGMGWWRDVVRPVPLLSRGLWVFEVRERR